MKSAARSRDIRTVRNTAGGSKGWLDVGTASRAAWPRVNCNRSEPSFSKTKLVVPQSVETLGHRTHRAFLHDLDETGFTEDLYVMPDLAMSHLQHTRELFGACRAVFQNPKNLRPGLVGEGFQLLRELQKEFGPLM